MKKKEEVIRKEQNPKEFNIKNFKKDMEALWVKYFPGSQMQDFEKSYREYMFVDGKKSEYHLVFFQNSQEYNAPKYYVSKKEVVEYKTSLQVFVIDDDMPF